MCCIVENEVRRPGNVHRMENLETKNRSHFENRNKKMPFLHFRGSISCLFRAFGIPEIIKKLTFPNGQLAKKRIFSMGTWLKNAFLQSCLKKKCTFWRHMPNAHWENKGIFTS